MKKITAILIRTAVLTVFLSFHACTFVPLEDKSDLPESVSVNVNLNWSQDVAEDEKPDGMYIAMSRIINSVHYVWTADPDGNLTGQLQPSGQPDQEDQSGQATASMTPEEPSVPDFGTVLNGEYYIMAFNSMADSYRIDALDEFASDPTVSMRDLVASVVTVDPAELDPDKADFNPSFTYVKEAKPLFLDVKKQSLDPDLDPEISFDMKSVTQKLTFRVLLETEEGVSIQDDRIMGEISGVAGSVQLMSAQVRDSSYRVLFTLKKTGNEGTRDMYEGVTNVFGLFPGNNSSDIIGAGILQLTITADCGDQSRRFHAGVNLSSSIRQAGLMEEFEDGSGYRAAKDAATFEVQSVLHISKDQIGPGDGSQGVEIWFDSDDNDIDIEV